MSLRMPYAPLQQSEIRVARETSENGLTRTLYVLETPFGYRRVAALWRSAEARAPSPLILWVHWYEPESHDSNRSQFEAEAQELASAGASCLTVETLWSDPDFFIKRTQADDLRASVEEAVNLRRFLDLLRMTPHADPSRVAVVGHDFGGMYAVLAGIDDGRPTHYVIMAAAPRFSDWYLYFPKLEGEGRRAFVQEMDGIDPIKHVAGLSPAPLFFQFADADPHVPRERAEEFFAAAREPKEMQWYSAGHGLNEAARADRLRWLRNMLRLT